MDKNTLSVDCLRSLGLTQQPFLAQPQDSFLYSDPALDMTANVIIEHLRSESPPVLLKGEYGIGKTTQLHKIMGRSPPDLHYCHIDAGPETSLAAIDYAVRLHWQPAPRHGEPKRLSLDQYLVALTQDGVRPVLTIDDAHHLEPQVLAQLLQLKQQLATDYGQVLGLVLAAEPSIEASLSLLEKRLPVVSRIYTVGVRPLNVEQTRAYLAHRLGAAGGTPSELLTPERVNAIQRESGGLASQINQVASRELEDLCVDKAASGNGEHNWLGRLVFPGTLALVVVGLLVSLYGLIAGLLGPGKEEAELPVPPTRSEPATATTQAQQKEQKPQVALQTADEAKPSSPKPPAAPAPAPSVEEPAGLGGETEITPPPERPQQPSMPAEPDVPAPAPAIVEPPPPPPEEPPPRAPAEPAVAKVPVKPPTPPPSPARTELRSAYWLMQQDPNDYSIQILGVSNEQAVHDFYSAYRLSPESAFYQTRRDGQNWYVLLTGVYPSAEAARRAIEALPPEVQANRPWIRRLGEVQSSILAARQRPSTP